MQAHDKHVLHDADVTYNRVRIMSMNPLLDFLLKLEQMADASELQAFFELAESTVTFVRQCYEEDYEQDIKDDVVDLLEEVLHYGVLAIDASDERFDTLIGTLHQLAVVMRSEGASESSVRRGRPEIDIGEEQLSYLLEQGFCTKDISTMFGCS